MSSPSPPSPPSPPCLVPRNARNCQPPSLDLHDKNFLTEDDAVQNLHRKLPISKSQPVETVSYDERNRRSASQDKATPHNHARSPSSLSRKRKRRASQAAQRTNVPSLSQQKPRSNFSKEQVQILQSWLDKNINSPYTNDKQNNELADSTSLTPVQVRDWFARYRKRKWNKEKNTSPTVIPIKGADRFIARGEPLDPVIDVESPPASMQVVRHQSSPSLQTYLHTPPKDEGFPPLTATSLQNDPLRFSFYTPDHNTVQSTLPTTRTGVKRTNQLASQQSGQSVLSNDTTERPKRKKGQRIIPSRPAARKRQGDEKFQCTRCNRGHRYQSDWARHEEVHAPQRKWICMRDGPRVFTNGDRTCAFCGKSDPTDEHLTTEHNAFLCSQKPEEQREFNRPDGLIRHMKESHNASNLTPPSAWMLSTHEHDTQQFWCGFCSYFLRTTWEVWLNHIANHYITDNYDMTRWKSEQSSEREFLNESFMFSSAVNPPYDGALEMDFDNPANHFFDGAANSNFIGATTPNFDAAANRDFDDAENPGFDGAPSLGFVNPTNLHLDGVINTDVDSIGNMGFVYPDLESL